jgi:hypothetical protein
VVRSCIMRAQHACVLWNTGLWIAFLNARQPVILGLVALFYSLYLFIEYFHPQVFFCSSVSAINCLLAHDCGSLEDLSTSQQPSACLNPSQPLPLGTSSWIRHQLQRVLQCYTAVQLDWRLSMVPVFRLPSAWPANLRRVRAAEWIVYSAYLSRCCRALTANACSKRWGPFTRDLGLMKS